MFLHNFRPFLENWIFEGISTGADLTKIAKICIISICAKKIFFGPNYLFHSSKEVFLHNVTQFLENWIFKGISTGPDLTKMVKICIILICAKKIFFGKIICSTHQRKSFIHNFTRFLENWTFEGISIGADLTKMVKICIILICAKKIFFGKIIYSTHQKKCFSTILGNFRKIEFLKEYRQARTLQKWWKLVLS